MSRRGERGVALIAVIVTLTLLSALGAALTLATITETAIAANYREAAEVLYAADTAVEFAVQEVAAVDDWRTVVSEPGQSAFVDGPADGIRTVGAVSLDLAEATLAINAIAPGSVLYAFGRLQDIAPRISSGPSGIYVAVWVADRSETAGEETPVLDTLSILGQAYGPRGSRRAVEATVEKVGTSGIRRLSWREWR